MTRGIATDDTTRLTVRPAVAAEYAEVARLTVAAYRASGMIPEGSRYGEQLADVAGRAAEGELLVALAGDRIVGTVTFCRYGSRYAEVCRSGEVEFRMLGVRPAARRAGVGEALVHAVLERAAATDSAAVVLSTPDTAEAAQRLYVRLGFVREPERDWSPIPGVSLLVYRREMA